ncbi:GNAT family N-acetyltransferase [Planosporangium flavigriseum]|uniref:GNAT family N-acetyltransferase n=1 Tax=Planosporangium flavigriseum TaxID=373681 RepID=UPI00143C8D2A|nr:GNAT family N-acetyltransferase [Planosporangium flavigriseum]NJC66925.1 GNAT family N-acetyltransferase [Planosporangium flavigriseum]
MRTLESIDDFTRVLDVLAAAFGEDFPAEDLATTRSVFEPRRSHVIEHDDDGMVAHAAAYTREVTVPGGVIPAAHVTLVGVRPTHRRRGLLTRLMAHQLRDVREHGEPVAMLWASEGRIYQRFGYGIAALRHIIPGADKREIRLNRSSTPEAGRLRDASPEQVRKDLQQVYERVRPERPGWSSRDENWWSRLLDDSPSRRQGYTSRRALLFEGPARVDGYALWRRKGDWAETGPKGEVNVAEVVAATPEAYLALWEFLFSVDLARTVRYPFAAPDEPLRYLVNEPRALGDRVADSLWVRLVDVPAALSTRRFAAPVDVVIDVTDALLPDNAGRWRLTGDATGAACTPTTDAADLACDVADLGAVYLGGTGLGALAAAGRVRELRPGAVAAVAPRFGWHRAPSALDIF